MTDLDELERLLATGAVQNLHEYQRQLDADGTFVGVSRQALDEVLTVIDAAPAMIAELKALRRAVAMSELIASTADEYGVQNNGTD